MFTEPSESVKRAALSSDMGKMFRAFNETPDLFPTNRNRIEINYYVVGKSHQAEKVEFLGICRDLMGTENPNWTVVLKNKRDADDTTHHVLTVRFGSGRAVYNVIWIEQP